MLLVIFEHTVHNTALYTIIIINSQEININQQTYRIKQVRHNLLGPIQSS